MLSLISANVALTALRRWLGCYEVTVDLRRPCDCSAMSVKAWYGTEDYPSPGSGIDRRSNSNVVRADFPSFTDRAHYRTAIGHGRYRFLFRILGGTQPSKTKEQACAKSIFISSVILR